MLSLDSVGAIIFSGMIYLIGIFTYSLIEKVLGGKDG